MQLWSVVAVAVADAAVARYEDGDYGGDEDDGDDDVEDDEEE